MTLKLSVGGNDKNTTVVVYSVLEFVQNEDSGPINPGTYSREGMQG